MRSLSPDFDPRLLITPERERRLNADDLLRPYNQVLRTNAPLRALSIKGLLSFREEVNFEFGKLNLLVGPNGSGKSNLISCIRLLRFSPLDIQVDFQESGFEEWLNKGLSEGERAGIVRASVQPPDLSELLHEIVFRPAPHARAFLDERISGAEEYKGDPPLYFAGSPKSEAIVLGGGAGRTRRPRQLTSRDYDPSQSILSREWDADNYPELKGLTDLYADFRLYTEWSFGRKSVLRESVPAGTDGRRISEALSNLPVVLRDLGDAAARQKIRDLLEELKETYRDFFADYEGRRVKTFIQEVPFSDAIPSERLSDGTLRFLALASILLHPNPSALICIEEPELGMHPDMIRLVGGMIADASKRTQVIVSTHSEHLLTAVEDDFDYLLAFDSTSEGTVVRRFDRDQFSSWQADHSLGELWTSGELGGNRW